MKRSFNDTESRPASPMSTSTFKSSRSSISGKRSSGYSVLDSARVTKKQVALQNLIYKLVPDYDHVSEQGYQGTSKEYSELITYASKVYKQTENSLENVVTFADQEVPWLKNLRERISKVLSEYSSNLKL